MKKELPFNENPYIKTYPYFANYIGILDANNIEYKHIIMNNFIFLKYIPITGQVNFFNKAILKKIFITEPFTYNISNVMNLIEESINNYKYIIICLDDTKLGLNTNEFLGVHNWIVYGYDDNKQQIKIFGYVRKKGCNYCKSMTISYTVFIKALPNLITKAQKKRISFNHICTLPQQISYSRHCLARNHLAVATYFIFVNCCIFLLLRVHNFVFSKIHIKPYKRDYLDLRDLRIIYEHSLALKEYSFFNKNLQINEIAELIEKESKLLLTIASKYHYKNDLQNKNKYRISVNKAIKTISKLEQKLAFNIIKNKILRSKVNELYN